MSFDRTAFGRNALLLLSAGLALLVAIAFASVWMSLRVRAFTETVAATQQARSAASSTLILLLDAETGQRGYLLTGDASYLAPYSHAVQAITVDLNRLHQVVTVDPALRSAIAALVTLAQGKLAELSTTIALVQQGGHDAAMAQVRGGQGKALMDQSRQQLTIVLQRLDRTLARAAADVQRSGRILLGVQFFGLALILALVALGAWVVRNAVSELEAARRATEAANAGLEERVRERTAALEQANEEVQRFAYIVSHDLRAPLVNIMGFTAELEAGVGQLKSMLATVEEAQPALVTAPARAVIAEEIPEAVGFIRSSTERMDRLINAILRISRAGALGFTPERIDMQALFARLAESVQHQLEEADATLTVERGLPDAVSDRVALEQVFGNLIDNAVKYLDPARPGRIAIRGRRQGAALIYEVADNGRGIAPADQKRVFELFRRAGTQDRPGEGIGLAHVRAMLRRLGGLIACESQAGTGSTFRVVLPVETGVPRGKGNA